MIPYKTLTIDFIGQIHNLAGLCTDLGIAERNTESILLAGWQRWGEALAEHLIGDYALVIRDKTRRITYLARNPLGVKPLYYRVDQGQITHGFSIPQLRERCPLPATKDMDWAAAYMLGLSYSQTETAYKEIKKVPPGHWLTCDNDGRVKIQRYHQWRDDAPFTTKRDPRWVEAYRAVLEEVIRCRMDPDAPMGTENSGGLDSSTITAYLARVLGDPGDRLHSLGFLQTGLEAAFGLEVSQASQIKHNYVVTTWRDHPEQFSVGLPALGYPQLHGNSVGHIPFYRECQLRGIGILFSGFGGDEVVTNHGSLLRWELLDKHQYAALWDTLPGNPLTRTLRLLKVAAMSRNKPAYRQNFLHAWNLRWPHQLLRPDVVDQLNLYERYMETAVYDAPYRRINDFILQHHLQRMRLTARLEDCTLVAQAYGIDYRWPLWDARLVQQYLSTPSIEKVGPNGLGRYLHRRAIEGVVPSRVAWKPGKDMGLSQLTDRTRKYALAQVAPMAAQLQSNLHPALEGLIDTDKLREQIRQSAHATHEREHSLSIVRNIGHLTWLNLWLHDGELPG